MPWIQEETGGETDAGCSRRLGRVVEPSADDKSTEICPAAAATHDDADSSAGAPRDSHVTVTDTSPVELYLDNAQHHFLLLLTGKPQGLF